MNPNDPLLTLLSSWTPRRPSPALKSRLFPTPPAPAGPTSPTFWLAWTAPALGCLMLLATLGVHPAGHVEAAVWPGFGGTNTPLYAASRPAAEQRAQNALTSSFTWTNHALVPSTNASLGGAN